MSSIDIKNNPLTSSADYPLLGQPRAELDLFALVDVLFKSRKVILSITALFIVMGLALAFLLPQKWTSDAVVSIPETPQLIELKRVLVDLQVLDVDAAIDASSLENMFLKKFDSRALQEKFLRTSPWVQAQVKEAQGDTESLQRAITLVAQRIKMVSNDNPKAASASPYSSWTLSFTAPKAQDAQRVLKEYINYAALAVQREVLENLRSTIELKVKSEESRLILDRNTLANEHKIAIQRLNYSLQVANAAGIKKPVYSNGQAVKDDPDYSIALGADGLAQKLAIERSITDVTALNAAIQNREYRLAELKKLNLADVDFQPFHYQMAPSLPMKSDGPGKALVLILAAMLGFIIACATVLVRDVFTKRQVMTQHASDVDALLS
ncbi:LPS O-antigen length regulator Wzz(fepE) [Cronobacter sakazakii]|uniref:LPS O-antigen length regulator Wzz(fepE) n=1 Tax=Cronobacter sakazakii TaxID=28141 RepID=UPI000B4A87DC|nr:LPS O-antigen length regulator Wzz(fepE) [Cronobacter sakazakii]EKA9348072.1 LPS O-antigen length regulator [Cronobacter sakazakii]EKK4043321.1 LPS O-antigen length regulator [Cronobacter sakazakii]ELL7784958.1 LPS O-antigen length regulator [Cronobacter sakazakii]ELY2559038.1 LPS O-antigen length regulator [Cronobacter sakazakii]ELY2752984.1 LPS O-antigen length regulator [Cronobacter sakazakii]